MIEKKKILITGANGGIGYPLVRTFLENTEFDVVCHVRENDEQVATLLAQHNKNPQTTIYKANLTDENDVIQMRKKIFSDHGTIWGVINLAGGSSNAMSWKLSKEEFMHVVEKNLLSTFLCCKEFIPHLRQQKNGRLINISSVVAFSGVAGASHYCAAKAGVVGLTKSLSLELAPSNVTVNSLALGYFSYGLINHIHEDAQEKIKATIPMKRFGIIEEIYGALSFLLSEAGTYTTGQVLHINGGMYS